MTLVQAKRNLHVLFSTCWGPSNVIIDFPSHIFILLPKVSSAQSSFYFDPPGMTPFSQSKFFLNNPLLKRVVEVVSWPSANGFSSLGVFEGDLSQAITTTIRAGRNWRERISRQTMELVQYQNLEKIRALQQDDEDIYNPPSATCSFFKITVESYLIDRF